MAPDAYNMLLGDHDRLTRAGERIKQSGTFAMIREFDIRRRGDAILVGIAVDQGVLDFETTETLLRECLTFMDTPHRGSVRMCVGKFGTFRVTLNIDHDDSLSIILDGPDFEPTRSQCAGIWLSKADLRPVISAALSGD